MADSGTDPRPDPRPDSPPDPEPRDSRRLSEAPSARFATRDAPAPGAGDSALRGPLLRAIVVAIVGAAGLVIVGAILASTFGLLFVAAGAGAAIGLVLSRAAVPIGATTVATPRGTVARLSVVLALAAVAAGALATWVIARAEGGALELVDYLLTTFGPFVPAEAVLAGVAAWWGATSGPVQR